jgi:hypothetical protein
MTHQLHVLHNRKDSRRSTMSITPRCKAIHHADNRHSSHHCHITTPQYLTYLQPPPKPLTKSTHTLAPPQTTAPNPKQRAETMCTKHTNIFACGHESSYLLKHSRFVIDPSACPQLSNIMLYVDQGCGGCDWEEEDDGEVVGGIGAIYF